MEAVKRRDFNKQAGDWDADTSRVKLANDVAEAVIREVPLSSAVKALDFGCGTGLVTLRLQPLVGKITGMDSSSGMLAALEKKVQEQGLTNVDTQLVDFERGDQVSGKFDLIVSSMTLHHIPDTRTVFKLWYDLLLPNGRLAFADLDKEDGSFHPDMTGVFHLGFDRASLRRLLEDTGFHSVRDTTAAVRSRLVKGQGMREFPIFLFTARK